MKMPERKKFAITMRKGFQIQFENGVLASVQFGAGNYCENRSSMDFMCQNDATSDDAEIAAIYKGEGEFKDEFITQEVWPDRCSCYDDVVGWLSPEEVLEFLNKCKEFDPATLKDFDPSTLDKDGDE